MHVFTRTRQAMPKNDYFRTAKIEDTGGVIPHRRKNHVFGSRAGHRASGACSHGNTPPQSISLPTLNHFKRLIPSLLSFVVIYVCAVQQSLAQTEVSTTTSNQAVDLVSTGLQIGDLVPDIIIENIHNYKATSAKLSDFKGKLLILDFWATWCSPCVAMLPKMDSLQREFGDKVQFVSVTYQTEEEAIPFLDALEKQRGRKYDLPVVVDDSELKALFPHQTLPHYVWIDTDGIVMAITSFEDLNQENLSKIVTGDEIKIGLKKDFSISYDWKDPLFFDESNSKFLAMHYSVFSGYTEGLSPGYYNTQPMKSDTLPIRITARNLTIPQLYQIALGMGRTFDWKQTILNVNEPNKIIEFGKAGNAFLTSLQEGRGFCYEIISTRESGTDVYGMMADDLAKFFPEYSANVRDIVQTCMVLRKLPGADLDRLRTKGAAPSIELNETSIQINNYTFNALVNQLNFIHSKERDSKVQSIFFFNETEFNEKVDLDINAGLGDLPLLNRELKKLGLVLVSENRPITMLVINDKP